MLKNHKISQLIFEDGTTFKGHSFGAEISVSGEVVFNTGMVGYPETLTDPSYCGQILVLTYPLIGNYGIPDETTSNGLLKNFESNKIHLKGLIVSDYSAEYSHWNAVKSLDQWMKEQNIPGIYSVDTRAITKLIREHGVIPGKMVVENDDPKELQFEDINQQNLVAKVSTKEKIVYGSGRTKILLIDCGVKYNIIRCFLKRGATVIRIPWDYDLTNEKYDGLFISNGPGDPIKYTITIKNVKKALEQNKPVFGICLGNQVLGIAAGAKTYKLKYGHRSQNQPCLEVGTKRCYITAQNHGYAIDDATLPKDWNVWFKNLNDGTNEGIKHNRKPFFSVQFHPEAAPGPTDTEFLFDRFIRMVKND